MDAQNHGNIIAPIPQSKFEFRVLRGTSFKPSCTMVAPAVADSRIPTLMTMLIPKKRCADDEIIMPPAKRLCEAHYTVATEGKPWYHFQLFDPVRRYVTRLFKTGRSIE
ncbi:hypothetical protein GGR58DRAFT_404831 [Xylaria digitata]|nr:hypothetical protein GGR58DRAFT_404831 [Xylaria digitata]